MLTLFAAYSPGMILALLAPGVAIGAVGGLLGIGGGVIAVPLLLELWVGLPLPERARAALAIGTAQAVIVLASLAAAIAHGRAGRIDAEVVRRWMPAMLAGAALGLVLAPFLPPAPMQLGFALIAALLALQLLRGAGRPWWPRLPGGVAGRVAPGAIGAASAALGIGAGTLSGPLLGLFGVALARAVGAGAMFNLVVAVPAALVFMLRGMDVPGRPPDAVGHVSLLALALLAAPAMLVAPFAARLAGRLPLALLRRLFAACLLAIAARLVLRALG
jgi:uncharacterized membrane protein YfcA